MMIPAGVTRPASAATHQSLKSVRDELFPVNHIRAGRV